MRLSEYLKTTKQTQLEFSGKSKVPQATISRAVNNMRIDPDNALKIEVATDKLVTIFELLYPGKTF